MLAPWSGRVFNPCCGSVSMFVQSLKFIDLKTGNGNGGKAKAGISVFGQESNHTTSRVCAARSTFQIFCLTSSRRCSTIDCGGATAVDPAV